MIYKTGHKDFPSITTYTDLIKNEGANSPSAAAYLARFSTDEEFIKKANIVRHLFAAAQIADKELK